MALNEIISGMPLAAEKINENFKNVQVKEDTGWINVPLTNVESGSKAQIRVFNDVVYFEGTINIAPAIRQPTDLANISEFLQPTNHIRLYGVPAPTATTFPENHAVVLSVLNDGRFQLSVKTDVASFTFQIARPV